MRLDELDDAALVAALATSPDASDENVRAGAYRVTVVLHDRAHPVGSFTFRAR
jgi:hypothetical protein